MSPQALLCALALVSLLSCRERTDRGPMPEPTRAPPPGFDVDTADRPALGRTAGPARVAPEAGVAPTAHLSGDLTDDDLERIRELLPDLSPADTSSELAPLSGNRLARAVLCYPDTQIDAAAASVETALRSARFENVESATPIRSVDRRTLTGERLDYKFMITIDDGAPRECEDTADTRIAISVSKKRTPTSKRTDEPRGLVRPDPPSP